MLASLIGLVVGLIAFFLYCIAIVVLGLLLFIGFFVWVLLPIPSWRRKLHDLLYHLPSLWSKTMQFTLWLTSKTEWEITGLEGLRKDKSYLLIANHQGFVDILVLQVILDRHLPQLRYFMKQELFWIPILGPACYILGYPFMKRYTKEYIKAHPEKANKDLETTQKACARFALQPVTLINYIEGTRFKEAKRKKQKSPYKHLLRPKAGGISFIIKAMEEQIDTLLNVTIVYDGHPKTSWGFLQGRFHKIHVHIEQIPITADLRGNYQEDPAFREHFQAWVNEIWARKDKKITEIANT